MGLSVELPQLALRYTASRVPAESQKNGIGTNTRLKSVTNRAQDEFRGTARFEQRVPAEASAQMVRSAPRPAGASELPRHYPDAMWPYRVGVHADADPATSVVDDSTWIRSGSFDILAGPIRDGRTRGGESNRGLPGGIVPDDMLQAKRSERGLVARIQQVPQLGISKLRRMLVSVRNTLKDGLFHRKDEGQLHRSEYLLFQKLRHDTRNDLLAGLPGLEATLQKPFTERDRASFQHDFRRMVDGLRGLSLLAARDARLGTLPKALASEISALASTATAAANQTVLRLSDRMVDGDLDFFGRSQVRRELGEFVATVKDASLRYADHMGDPRLMQLQHAALPRVDESGLDPASVFTGAFGRMVNTLPRLEVLLEGPIPEAADYLEYRRALKQLASGMEQFVALSRTGVDQDVVPEQLAEAIASLASPAGIVVHGQVAMDVWDRIRSEFEQPNDRGLLSDPGVREGLRNYIWQVWDLFVEYANHMEYDVVPSDVGTLSEDTDDASRKSGQDEGSSRASAAASSQAVSTPWRREGRTTAV